MLELTEYQLELPYRPCDSVGQKWRGIPRRHLHTSCTSRTHIVGHTAFRENLIRRCDKLQTLANPRQTTITNGELPAPSLTGPKVPSAALTPPSFTAAPSMTGSRRRDGSFPASPCIKALVPWDPCLSSNHSRPLCPPIRLIRRVSVQNPVFLFVWFCVRLFHRQKAVVALRKQRSIVPA